MIRTLAGILYKVIFNKAERDRWVRWHSYTDIIESAISSNKREINRLVQFRNEFNIFKRASEDDTRGLMLDWSDRYPCLDDKTSTTGFDRHYIYHPAWAVRIIARTRPERHVDISSTLNFSAILSAFVPVSFYDYRPAPLYLDGLECGSADLLNLPFADGSIASLSCMHVLEHIGLGRYGDPLQPDGDLLAIRELIRVLAPGGDLLIVVPVGRPKIMFNAHRIYDFEKFRGYFSELELLEFSLIPDNDGPQGPQGLLASPPAEFVQQQEYGCGCYWFRK